MFQNLTYDEKKEIAFISNSKNYEKGENVYLQGEQSKDLYIIHKGQIKISRLNKDGKEQVIRILEPGSFMGELSIFNEDVHSDSAVVLENTEICQLNGDAFKSLLTEIPTISLKLLSEMSKRLDETEDVVESIGTMDVTARVASQLLAYSKGKDTFTLPLSKKDLASHLGMSYETLSRKLRDFESMAYLEMSGQRDFILKNRKELEALL